MCSLQIAETNNPNRTCKLYLRYGEYHVICDATKIFILKNHRFQASSASVDLFRHSAKIITTTVYMSDVWRPNGRTDGRAATCCNFDCLFLQLLFSSFFFTFLFRGTTTFDVIDSRVHFLTQRAGTRRDVAVLFARAKIEDREQQLKSDVRTRTDKINCIAFYRSFETKRGETNNSRSHESNE